MKRYWILPVLVTAFIFLLIPFTIMLQKQEANEHAHYINQLEGTLGISSISQVADDYTGDVIQSKLFTYANNLILLLFPVAISIQLFSFLNKNKSVSFIHGLPLSKLKIYATNYITGIILTFLPYVINFIILLLLHFFGGFGDYLPIVSLLQWLGVNLLFTFIFLTFSNLVAMISGTSFSHGALTYIFMYFPIIFITMLESLIMKIIYGFPGFSERVVDIISEMPSVKLFGLFILDSTQNTYLSGLGWGQVIAYFIMTIILIIVGYWIYDKRKLERAGEFIVFTPIKVIIKYLLVFLVFVCAFLYNMQFSSNRIQAFIIGLVYSFLGYVAIEMILQKTYKIVNSLKGFAFYAIILTILFALFAGNIFGYEDEVPNPNEVAYATIDSSSQSEKIQFTEQENIKDIIEIQKEAIENKNQKKDKNTTYYAMYICYHLKNGEEITRRYESADYPETRKKLYNTEEYIRKTYSYLFDDRNDLDVMNYYIQYGSDILSMTVAKDKNKELMDQLIEAIKTDLLEFNIHTDDIAYSALTTEEEKKITYISMSILAGTDYKYGYVQYNIVKENYKLMQIIEQLIEEENEIIKWEENEK